MNRKVIYFFAYLALFVAFLFVMQNATNATGEVIISKEPMHTENNYFGLTLNGIYISGQNIKVDYSINDLSGKSGNYIVKVYDADSNGAIIDSQEVVLDAYGTGKYATSFKNNGYNKLLLVVSNGQFQDELIGSPNYSGKINGNVVSDMSRREASLVILAIIIFVIMFIFIKKSIRKYGYKPARVHGRRFISLKLD